MALAQVTLAGLAGQAAADTRPVDPNDPATPVTVSDDALPAPQINGVVWTQAMIGNTVYVGGSFSNARPAGSAAGQNTVARGNMLAFDVTTGVLDSSFAPSFNGQIRSITVSPDKTRIYVGGEFTTVNGQSRRRIAAFNASTGALITSFAPSVNYDVDAVVATNDKVFIGGSFLGVGNASRQYLAAFTASNGALLDWAPQATGGTVSAMTINPQGTKVVVGGSFTALNGSSNPGYGLAMIDTTTGASLPFAVNDVGGVRNGTIDGAITTLSTDGTYVYGGGYTFGKSGGTWEGTFSASWNAGEINFLNDCHGDTYSVFPIGSVIYQAGHAHYCDNIDGPRQGAGGVGTYPYYRATAMSREATGTATWEPDQGRYYDFSGKPSPSILGWYPDINAGTFTGQSQGAWSITGNSDYVVAAGEFTRVNNANHQGIVRFAVSSKAPNDSGPKLFNASYPLNVTSTEAGKVRINWQANNDDDNENLTYRVYRDTQTSAGLKYTITERIRRWETKTRGFTDTGLEPGSTHQYRVVVTDPFGNAASSPFTPVTVAASGTDSNYVKAVYDSQPTNYWRLGEAAGTTASADRVGNMPLAASGTTPSVRGTQGAIAGDADTASTFVGNVNTSWTASAVQHQAPDVFSLETWFKTTSTTGGKLIGWSNRNTQGNSSKHDRQLYMDNAGKISFGVKPAATRIAVTSANSYNNDQWHHAVGTLSKSGMKLYVDGVQVGSNAAVTVGEHLNIGYWRVGGDTLNGWPPLAAAPAVNNGFFNGSLDEIAVYKQELTPAEVAAHYNAAGVTNPPANVAPTAAFTSTTDGLTVEVDASTSADPDGTVTSYAWSYEGGGTSTGKTASHTFAAAGTYDVTLTVTDNRGATDTEVQQVTVTAANVSPTAAFTSATRNLTVDVDGSTSADPDGTIASYAWSYEGGGSANTAVASHTFAAAGTYDVTLTVTDDDGATNSVTKSVTVQAVVTDLARDSFGRTTTGGWGSAEVGGVWTRSGTATNYAVTGGVGTMRMGAAGSGPSMALNGVSSNNTEVKTTVGMDKAATGGGIYATVRPRIMPGGDRYYVDTRYVAGGTVSVILGRNVGAAETALQTRTVTGLTVAPGDRLNVLVQAYGTSPTTLRAKVWKVGATEPTAWTASVTDSAVSLQGSGAVGLGAYLSGSATNAPMVGSFDNLVVRPTP